MIILNEKDYAEDCLRKHEINTKPFQTLSILAKYYYYCKGFRYKKIVKLLTEYIERCYPNYVNNKMSWENTIDKLAKNVKKYTLYEIEGVSITSNEMSVIDALNNEVLKRLAFTLLCLAKLGNLRNINNNGWVNNDAKEIFELARIACTAENRYVNLGMLGNLGLLEFPKRLDNLSARVTFIDPTGDEVLFVSDFRELGYEYLNYKGGNFTRCSNCGKLFRNNKCKSKRYCNSCAHPEPMGTKRIRCVDCGKYITVSAKDNQTNRCNDCYAIYRRKYHRENKRKQGEKSD